MGTPEKAGRRGSSLRGRLVLVLVGPLAVLLVLGGVGSYGLAQYFADTVYDGWLFDSVSSLALEVESTPDGPFVDMPASTQRLFEWDVVDRTYFRITGKKKGLIAGRPDMPPIAGDVDPYKGAFYYDLLADLTTEVTPGEVAEPREGALIYDGQLDGQAVRVAALELPAEEYGETVTLEVAETTRKRQALAQAILLSTLTPQLVLLLVAGIAVRRGVIHGLGPLRKIAERLQSRSHRELSPIADQGVPEEVRPLTRSLNDLLARLEVALTAQRRFIAEAAHQLRTPLTAIKLNAEDVSRESTMEGARPLLVALRASTDRAVRLSNQLLSLARAEPDGTVARTFETVDLHSLVQETGAEWAPRALERGIEMQFTAENDDVPVLMEGDPGLLREAISNLVDNAIKYHPGSGTILLRVAAQPSPQIVIEDDGPGIHPDERPQMLGRFVRGRKGEGSGLGLSIALEIARIHRGTLNLEDAPGGRGLLVRLSFPRSGDSLSP
ncbi:MAG TPA: sensor histidine kinase N-terminal domain-containing protein [Vicinamibacterales bacterium]|nr:sensor histidine kinase N-terminal domain-containing protein [Vicinamibacterales bacterium]